MCNGQQEKEVEMKRIEKPDWIHAQLNYSMTAQEYGQNITKYFHKWFDSHVEPINKLIDNKVEVTAFKWEDNESPKGTDIKENVGEWACGSGRDERSTHRAYLIDIQEIKKDSYEQICRDYVEYIDNRDNNFPFDNEIHSRAKKLIGSE